MRRFISRELIRRAMLTMACSLALLMAASRVGAQSAPVTLKYWDKWTGNERAAMQAVIDDFHASQDRIVVEFLSVSEIVKKTLIATAGGNPPDVAGVWANDDPGRASARHADLYHAPLR